MTELTNQEAIVELPPDLERTKVFEALAQASVLYDRYVDIVDVANIVAFQQSLPVNDSHNAPLGLVIWPPQ